MLDNELDELLNSSENETPPAETQEQHKRKSLGRGLGALLGDDDLTADDVLLPTDTPAADRPIQRFLLAKSCPESISRVPNLMKRP